MANMSPTNIYSINGSRPFCLTLILDWFYSCFLLIFDWITLRWFSIGTCSCYCCCLLIEYNCAFSFSFLEKKKFLFPQFVTVFFVMYNGWHGVAPAPTKGILGNTRLYWTRTMFYAPKQNFQNSYICKFLILLIWIHSLLELFFISFLVFEGRVL